MNILRSSWAVLVSPGQLKHSLTLERLCTTGLCSFPRTGFTYLTNTNFCDIGKPPVFRSALPESPALLLGSSSFFPGWIFLTSASVFRSCCSFARQKLLNCQEFFSMRSGHLSVFSPASWTACTVPGSYHSLFSGAWTVHKPFLCITLVSFWIQDTQLGNNIHSNNLTNNMNSTNIPPLHLFDILPLYIQERC